MVGVWHWAYVNRAPTLPEVIFWILFYGALFGACGAFQSWTYNHSCGAGYNCVECVPGARSALDPAYKFCIPVGST